MNGFARILYIKTCNIPSLKKVVCFGKLSGLSLVKIQNPSPYPYIHEIQYGRLRCLCGGFAYWTCHMEYYGNHWLYSNLNLGQILKNVKLWIVVSVVSYLKMWISLAMQKNGGNWVSYYQGWTGSATLKAMQREKEYIKWCKNIRKCSKRQLKSRFVRGKSYYQQKRDMQFTQKKSICISEVNLIHHYPGSLRQNQRVTTHMQNQCYREKFIARVTN